MALIICLCLAFTACGKSSSDDDDRDEDSDIVYDNGDDNYRDDNKYGEYELERDIKSANANEYLDKYLYRTNIYYYKVRAYYTVNGAKVYGPFSEPQEVIFEQN